MFIYEVAYVESQSALEPVDSLNSLRLPSSITKFSLDLYYLAWIVSVTRILEWQDITPQRQLPPVPSFMLRCLYRSLL